MNVARTGKVIDVLLVEDDPGDVLMTREAFEDNKVANRLQVVADGVSALAFLRKEGEHADAPTPDLVLLDLNLPRMDGREVLEAIRLETVSALGYAFQIETTYRAITAGFEIVEIPIIFSDRRIGESKMSRAIVAEAAWRVPLMRFRGARWR